MAFERNKLAGSSDDFFALKGSAAMKLTPAAAERVCRDAVDHDLIVIRVEGGIWHNPGFEARIDCIWDGVSTGSKTDVFDNNIRAAKFVRDETGKHNAFIITTRMVL